MSFYPAARFNREYRAAIKEKAFFEVALESSSGIYAKQFEIDTHLEQTSHYLERAIKFLLWSVGAHTLYLKGDSALAKEMATIYSKKGKRAFDVEIMEKAYRQDFSVVITGQLPESRENQQRIGGHLDGQRIGFDLGASDYKIAAVIDGEVIFSQEIPWNPTVEADPNYHYQKINEGLKLAASKLSSVDAIGGSSAGVVIDNQIRIASLFRSVDPERFDSEALTIFSRLEKEWGVPLKVINDGDVTALAGAMSLKRGGILGIAMGSSEACGFVDQNGLITGQLNELAFAPVDYAESAAQDEWSKDFGVGANYFSQQAVNRLALEAGVEFSPELGLPERLVEIQRRCQDGDSLAIDIFKTIGTYLGHTVVYYREFYNFEIVLILGRVTSGRGGELILTQAREVLKSEYPESNIRFEVPDEKQRRVGQAIAAASLVEAKK